MTDKQIEKSLSIAEEIFEKLVKKCKKKIIKLEIGDFNINPFTHQYLANVGFGNTEPISIAKTLVYPRVFGTSIATSLGTQLQKFCITAGFAKASAVDGIDIEFIDKVDKLYKYCQIKAGPQTINRGDIRPICESFKAAKRRLKTNGNQKINDDNFALGVLYGQHSDLSNHYKQIEEDGWTIYAGKEFWYHLTGDEKYYKRLKDTFEKCAQKYDFSTEIEDAIQRIARQLK